MIKAICVKCGKEFIKIKSAKRCKKCLIRKCPECGKEFVGNKSNRKKEYCSNACYKKNKVVKYKEVKCFVCNKVFKREAWRIEGKYTYCSSKCQGKHLSKKQIGANNPVFKGFHYRDGGYKWVYAPYHPNAHLGSVAEHRLIMEKHLKRFLKRYEIIHHIDGDPYNNDIENLHLCSQKEHVRIHNEKNYPHLRSRCRLRS